MGRKKQHFRPNVLEEGVSRTSRWRLVGTGMCEMTSQRSLFMRRQVAREADIRDYLPSTIATDMKHTQVLMTERAKTRRCIGGVGRKGIEIHRDDLHVESLLLAPNPLARLLVSA